MFLSHFTLSFHFNVVVIIEIDFSSPPTHKQPLFESKNLWSNVCYSDIEELLRYSTLYIKSFSTLQFNLFIRINYEIVFHKSATFIYILCWELFAAWCQYIERFDNQLDQIQNGWIVYATHLQSKSGFGRRG